MKNLDESGQICTHTCVDMSFNTNCRKSYLESGFRHLTWRKHAKNLPLWILLSGHAVIMLGMHVSHVHAEDISVAEQATGANEIGEAYISNLRRIEDSSVISNEHTSKWRVFTDKGRELFLQGKLDEAEHYFILALQEAKDGFGERDPHVASACNNLAELYRIRKEFEKAEPLYLEAIDILDKSLGCDDIRVGFAFHNLGGFYLLQGKLEQARMCYEQRALKIKGHVLGLANEHYATTLFHLGEVFYLQGKLKDSEALIRDSIKILEEAGKGESVTCIKRMRRLAQILLESNQLHEAEKIQRKILHVLELSKGWTSLDTVLAAESLAMTLQSLGNLSEAQDLLERCLDARKTILHENHIQVAANILQLARVAMLKSSRLSKGNILEEIAELDKAKTLLETSIRIARQTLEVPMAIAENMSKNGKPSNCRRDKHAALVILMKALDTLGRLEVTKHELSHESKDRGIVPVEAEHALLQCISAVKEFDIPEHVLSASDVKREYLSCMRDLEALLSESTGEKRQQSAKKLQELRNEIRQIESELSRSRKKGT
ncbi:kinesin light chain 3 isoform X3 [Amborella trichopoda]|uniref:kinesin light chain 3 isoform X3 n=1 Tax=Amborella trichopoda TaxID=13333 RepID=UPI0009BECDAC|nr:kinesin light chain 3 isoform X3 [Amborella trichopoda]|eukprot:XP_020531338.1 kinesin light chain 3 isoform X3 [Amborella trichopoda]